MIANNRLQGDDNGTGSKITGFTALHRGVGPQVAAAQEQKRQRLQMLEAVGWPADSK